MKVAIGSTNQVKIDAVIEAFLEIFSDENLEFIGVEVDSGVAKQPMSIEETLRGARNRARNALLKTQDSDVGVGLEGGIAVIAEKLYSFGAICVLDRRGVEETGFTPFYELPENFIQEFKNGKELGDIIDEIVGIRDTKKSIGAIGWLTGGTITRKELYLWGVLVVIGKFKRRKLK